MTAIKVAPFGDNLNGGVLLNGVFSGYYGGKRSLNLSRQHISQESQTAHVHADNRYLLNADTHSRLEERAVATHRNDKVGIEVIAVEHVDTSKVEHVLGRKEVVKLTVEHYTFTARLQERQHTQERSRLARLERIAENGECQRLVCHHTNIYNYSFCYLKVTKVMKKSRIERLVL